MMIGYIAVFVMGACIGLLIGINLAEERDDEETLGDTD